MSSRVVTAVAPSGSALAVKRAAEPHLIRRLVYEAEVLRAAAHPGVVDLVACEQGDDGVVTLATEFVGMHSLDTIGPLSTERAAALVAATATTLADLHERGLVHGRIEPAHVLIGRGDRPVLCGWSGGGQAGSIPLAATPVPHDFRDPARDDETPLIASIDVYGLGAVLRTLIIEGGTELEPIPERRFRLRRWRTPWTGYRRRALLTIADHATDDEPMRRPPARRLAAAIREVMPEAGAPERAAVVRRPAVVASTTEDADDEFASLRPRDDVPRKSTRQFPVAAIIAIAVVLSGAWWWSRNDSLAAARPPASAAMAPAPEVATSSVKCTAVVAPAADIDGDGCREPVRVRNGNVVSVGKQRFTVGQVGDVVAVGDWDCDGSASVAALRPSTGDVFFFDRWAAAGSDVSVTAQKAVQGAVAFVDRDPSACGPLSVRKADGSQEVVS